MSIRGLTQTDTGVDMSAPLKTLYHSHDGILAQLRELAALPGLATQSTRTRELAKAAVALFRSDVLAHHAEEEQDLFPAVIRSATEGQERELVESLTRVLVAEHRDLEQTWKHLEPSIAAAAKGRDSVINAPLLDDLLTGYAAHAKFEEELFLPLAQKILARNPDHLAAVGVSLHLHRSPDLPGYI
jgi:hemerythrin-like domain-containing protein